MDRLPPLECSAIRSVKYPTLTNLGTGHDPLVPTVFHNHWWLEAATAGRYQEAEVMAGGRTIARFPYLIERKFGGQRECRMPEITHFLGPAIDAGPGSAANRSLKTYHLTQELLAQIGSHGGFYHKLHRGINETLAFDDAGYTTLVEFTYEIEPTSEAQIWRDMRAKTRNVIRRAEERWQVTPLDDPHAFAAIYERNLKSRGLVNIYSRIADVCTAAIQHRQGHILAVKDAGGLVLGAVFVVWDAHAAYYLLSTRVVDCDNGVISLLLWAAIRDACAKGIVFDFDGLGGPGNRLFFTGFGGKITPRLIATKHRLGYLMAARMHRVVAPWSQPGYRPAR